MIDLPVSRECSRCSLRGGCGQVVWGRGDPRSAVVVVGHHPGDEEDLMGEPFVSREGRYLRKLLGETGLGGAFLTYLVKCHPGKADPTDAQVGSCRENVWREVEEVCPKVVVTLGARPTRAALGLKKSFKLGDHVGRFNSVPWTAGLVAPWYSESRLLGGGKKLVSDTRLFLKEVLERTRD